MDLVSFKEGCNPLCRACSHRGWSKERSLNQKQEFVVKTLGKWSDSIHPIESVDDSKRWHYRTSVTLAAEWDGHQWLFGTRSRDDLIPIHHCPVHHPNINNAVDLISTRLPSSSSFPLAFLVFNKAQCTLIVKQKLSNDFGWFTAELHQKLVSIGVKSFWVHFNQSAGRRLFEKGGWVHLFGDKLSVDPYGLVYGPTSFQQQIAELYQNSLDKAEAFLIPDRNTAMVDLYCGTGTSLSRWRKKNVDCVGVETSAEALECAAINAPGAYLLRGACRLRIPQLSQWILQQLFLSKQVLLYANPPRTGIEQEVLHWIVRVAKPQRIAYLSCSPGTLYKNLIYLTENQYEISSIQPIDFFPQTHHVECLCLINRRL